MSQFLGRASIAAIAAAIVGSGSPAYGQAPASAPAAADADADADDAPALEEIVVTAQRREQKLQEVPIALTTFTAQALESAGVGFTDQLLTVSPGVTIQRQLAGATPFIRGIGTQTVAPGIESAVATYVDGVYYMSPYANIFNFNNVQQIEVLRGPQGTLFGRNATGGLLSIVTREPQADPMFKGTLSYGNYDTVDASAYATAGSENVAFDVAGQLTHQDNGYGRNVISGADVNYRRERGVRSKLVLKPGDEFKITLSADYSKLKSDLGFILQPVPGSVSVIGTPAAGTRYDTNANFPQFNRVKYYGGSAKLEYDLGPVHLSSLSAYRRLNVNLQFDQDSTPARIVDVIITQRDRSFQQEFLAQGRTGDLDYTAGLFYFDSIAGYLPLNIRSVAPATNFDLYTDLSTKSYAAFTQLDYDLSDQTTVTAGVRYTSDKRGYTGALRPPGANPSIPGNAILSAVGSETFPKLTWRLALNQKLSGDANLYGSYSRGFKAGAFGTGSVSNVPIEPETIDAFEAGLKSEFLDRRVRVNVSAFYYDYKNIQLNRIVNGGSVLLNAAKGRLYGGELETSYVTPAGAGDLTLNANLAYLDTRYTSFPDGPTFTPRATGGSVQGTADLSGNDLIHAPDFTASVGANYTAPIGNGAQLELSGNYYHSASFFWEPENRVKQPSYDLLSAQAAISFADGRYRVRVFGRNLTDTFYYAYVSSNGLGDGGAPADPRTYGIGFDITF